MMKSLQRRSSLRLKEQSDLLAIGDIWGFSTGDRGNSCPRHVLEEWAQAVRYTAGLYTPTLAYRIGILGIFEAWKLLDPIKTRDGLPAGQSN